MGLDMQLYRLRKEDYPTLRQSPDPYKVLENRGIEVSYWRNHRALHMWFVQNACGGQDDCVPYEVTKDVLKQALQENKNLLKEERKRLMWMMFLNRKYIDIDETFYDWNYLKQERKELKRALHRTNWKHEMLLYLASW